MGAGQRFRSPSAAVGTTLICFDDVSKVYAHGATAVDRLTLEVPNGMLTVFVGPSGCGKTTALRMINRMVDPTSGTITVDGTDVSTVNAVKLRLGIGYVIQDAGLMPHQRVIDNVATVPVLKGQPRRAARKAGYEVLERVGLDPKVATRYPAQLSGGEQQRVGVARALAADPPILLMDEPFSAVDPVVRHELQNEILRLQAELHKTIVFVTHDIDEALKLADLVAVFAPGGALAQYDETARLLSSPANDFVSKFIGLGRGYRWLQLFDAAGLPVRDIEQVSVNGLSDARDRQVRDGWVLVVDGAGAPLGWIDADGRRRHRGGAALSDAMTVGGSVFRPNGNLSQALDAALSSPSGVGVAVDGGGKVIGGILAADVLAEFQKGKKAGGGASHALPDDPPGSGLGADRRPSAPLVAAGADRADERGAVGPAGAARAAASPADDGDRQRYIHHPVASAIRGVAADHRNPDPRRGQCHCGVGGLHHGPAGAGGARSAGRGAGAGA